MATLLPSVRRYTSQTVLRWMRKRGAGALSTTTTTAAAAATTRGYRSIAAATFFVNGRNHRYNSNNSSLRRRGIGAASIHRNVIVSCASSAFGCNTSQSTPFSCSSRVCVTTYGGSRGGGGGGGGSSNSKKTTVNSSEVGKFGQLNSKWWDPKSRAGTGILHAMNLPRVQFIREKITELKLRPTSYDITKNNNADDDDNDDDSGSDSADKATVAVVGAAAAPPLQGLSILDVGCGGGLLSESLARLGASVKGIDPSYENIALATSHSLKADPLTRGVVYECTTIEELVDNIGAEGQHSPPQQQFDVVTALEVVEHVEQLDLFLTSLVKAVKPGGLLFLSTINKTAKSYVLTILGAEYIARLLPVGTHDWQRFISPADLTQKLTTKKKATVSSSSPSLTSSLSCKLVSQAGMIYDPLKDIWTLDESDLDVNYIACYKRQNS